MVLFGPRKYAARGFIVHDATNATIAEILITYFVQTGVNGDLGFTYALAALGTEKLDGWLHVRAKQKMDGITPTKMTRKTDLDDQNASLHKELAEAKEKIRTLQASCKALREAKNEQSNEIVSLREKQDDVDYAVDKAITESIF